MKLGSGLSFSWKRALGVTKAKRRVLERTDFKLSRAYYARPRSSE